MSEQTWNINDVKPLTTAQYDGCREAALGRVQKRIGEKPTRRQFERELGPLWTVLDGLALVVFVAALVVSSVHIIQHMGGLATLSFAKHAGEVTAGTRIGAGTWTNVHQWGYIALSEASMVLFMVLFALTRGNWRRWVFVALALVAGVFVVLANWSSGTGVLESIMPPIFTLGIGFHLERLIVSSLKRRKDVTDRYLEALAVWERATADPTDHPDYIPVLRQELWQKLVSLKANKEFADAGKGFKVAAVERERQRDTWAYEGPSVEVVAVAPKASQKSLEHAHSIPKAQFTTNGHGATHHDG